MPSFPDLHDVDQVVAAPAGPVAPADVLARVKAEGLRRRTRRHRRNGVLAALGIALLAVPAVAMLPERGDDDVTVAAEGDDRPAPATTEARRPTTTASTATTAPTATTVPPTTVAVEGEDVGLIPPLVIDREPPATTVPAGPVCRNATDPACGEFRWDPAPAPNQPLSAGFGPLTQATAGVPFTIEVNWADPDAADLTFDHFSPDGVGLARACTIEPRHGPWTPPPPANGAGQVRYTHTFETPGTYTVVVSLGTADCNSPYGSDVTVEQTITVV